MDRCGCCRGDGRWDDACFLFSEDLSGSEKAFRFALTDPLDMRILLLGQRQVATAAVTDAELTERARFPAALMKSGCNGESMLIEDNVAVAESWVRHSAPII